MLVEVKEGDRWVQKDVSEWSIEVMEGGRWVLYGSLHHKRRRSSHNSRGKAKREKRLRPKKEVRKRRIKRQKTNNKRHPGQALSRPDSTKKSRRDRRFHVLAARYCVTCHQQRVGKQCMICGNPCPTVEQLNRLPDDSREPKRGHFFVQGGRPDSNRRRH